MARQTRKPKRRRSRLRALTTLKNKVWIFAGILVISVAILATVGPRMIELDQYLDAQLERMKARR
jgi:hypothetical protein